jgi:hypothetical protein
VLVAAEGGDEGEAVVLGVVCLGDELDDDGARIDLEGVEGGAVGT